MSVQEAWATDGVVAGVVKEAESGRTVSGVSVGFEGVDAVNEGIGRSTATTAAGTYNISLPPGGYRVQFLRTHFDTYDVLYFNQRTVLEQFDRVVVVAGKTTSGINALMPYVSAGTVEGVVSDYDYGLPIANASIRFYRSDNIRPAPDFRAYTGADGAYRINLPTGSYKVAVSREGYPDRVFPEEVLIEQGEDVIVEDGKTTGGVSFVLRSAAGYFFGTTQNVHGDAVPGIRVEMLDASTSEALSSTVSATDGTWRIEGVHGRPGLRLLIRFVDPSHFYLTQYSGYADEQSNALVWETPAGPFIRGVQSRLLTGRASITGHLVNEDGVPASGVQVEAVQPSYQGSRYRATTDSSGDYLIGGLPVVSKTGYVVQFFDPASRFFTEFWRDAATVDKATVIELAAGASATANDELTSLCDLSGTVSDVFGKLQGITVSLYGADGTLLDSRISSTVGTYQFGRLHTGAYRLGFSDPSKRHVAEYYHDARSLETATAVVLSAAARKAVVDEVLLPTTISGTVRAGVKTPGGIGVALYDAEGQALRTVTTNSSGRYDLGPASHGTYRLGFADPSGDYKSEYHADQPTLAEATPIVIDEDHPYAVIDAELTADLSIRGVVRADPASAWQPAWPDITVTLRSLGGEPLAQQVTAREFAFRHLTPGTYLVEFTDPSGRYVGEYYADAPGFVPMAAPLQLDAAHPHLVVNEYLLPALAEPGARDDGSPDAAARLTGPANGHGFGLALALEGDTLVIGSRWQPLPLRTGSGLVAVYRQRGGAWVREAVLCSPQPTVDTGFGSVVDIEGERIAVTALYDDGRDLATGRVYLFTRGDGEWSLETTLVAAGTDAAAKRGFGADAALSGNTVVVGAPSAKSAGAATAGAAYVFVRDGAGWRQQARLTASQPLTDDYFGRAVAVHGDRIVVGAEMDDTTAGVNAGSAFVFERAGDTWTRTARLVPSSSDIGNQFGGAVALVGDVAMVGARGELYHQGAVHVFRKATGGWLEQGRLLAADGQMDDEFGGSIDLEQGAVVISATGAGQFDGMSQGLVYRFVEKLGRWYQEARLCTEEGHQFGAGMALSGHQVAASIPYDRPDPEIAASGAVLIHERYVTVTGEALTVAAAEGVLVNDSAPGPERLVAELVDEGGGSLGQGVVRTAHGAIDLAGDGSFTYAPDAGFAGLDRFYYRAVGGEWSSQPAVVSILVRDLVAPTVTVSKLPSGWVNTPVTVTMASWNEGGDATIDYRRRAAVPWARYSSPVVISRQGTTTYDVRSSDVYGNGARTSFALKIDTRRPVPSAPYAAVVSRGGTARLKYKITDARPGSPTATVTLRIRDARNVEKWRVTLKGKSVNTLQTYSFRCLLPRGAYRFLVSATDAAGNPQTKLASNKLTVR